jgi:hypothetical protein
MARFVTTMVHKSDWNAMYYVAIGGDAHIHAPDDGWPEDVTIALTDAPDAALKFKFEEHDHGAMQLALSTEEALAVTWDNFKIDPWVGVMVLPAGKRLRCRSERRMGLRVV